MTRPHKNWLEWLVFAMSLVVIAGFIGVLVYAAFMTKDAPASLRVFLGEPRKEQSHFIVPVLVQNRGGAAAAAVRIEVVLDSLGAGRLAPPRRGLLLVGSARGPTQWPSDRLRTAVRPRHRTQAHRLRRLDAGRKSHVRQSPTFGP